MDSIRDVIKNQAAGFERVGYKDLTAQFVMRNGKVFDKIEPWPGKHMTPKECYTNATQVVLGASIHRPDGDLEYVEGYAMRNDIMFPFQHAWVLVDGERVLDPTLRDPHNYQYFGVPFSPEFLYEETMKNGYYGLYCPDGIAINVELFEKFDKEMAI